MCRAPQCSSGKGCVLMLQIMSMGWLDKRRNQDSVRAKRSSVCCSVWNIKPHQHYRFITWLKHNKLFFCRQYSKAQTQEARVQHMHPDQVFKTCMCRADTQATNKCFNPLKKTLNKTLARKLVRSHMAFSADRFYFLMDEKHYFAHVKVNEYISWSLYSFCQNFSFLLDTDKWVMTGYLPFFHH